MKNILIVSILVLFISCQKDIENITVKGSVVNSLTNKPLKNVDVKVICWFYGNSPDQSYSDEENKTVTTNEKGEYSVNFDKGAYVEIKVNHISYSSSHETIYINSKINKVNINLVPE